MVNTVTVTPCYARTGKAWTFIGDMIGYLWRPSEPHVLFSYGQWESCDNTSTLLSECYVPGTVLSPFMMKSVYSLLSLVREVRLSRLVKLAQDPTVQK